MIVYSRPKQLEFNSRGPKLKAKILKMKTKTVVGLPIGYIQKMIPNNFVNFKLTWDAVNPFMFQHDSK